MFGMRFPVPADFPMGDGEVICAVRPECFTIDRPRVSAVRGMVADLSYHGSLVRYRVRIAGAVQTSEVSVEVPGPRAVFGKGDPVSLGLDRQDITLFDEKTNSGRTLETERPPGRPANAE